MTRVQGPAPKFAKVQRPKIPVPPLNSIALSGRQAWEVCTDLITYIASLHETIAKEQVYFLNAWELLLQEAVLPPAHFDAVFSTWMFFGYDSIPPLFGPVGRSLINQLPTEFDQFNLSAAEYAVPLIMQRAFPQNSLRVRVRENHQKRVKDS